jgi:DNA-binding LacI/PurR family transcriptional regulator/AraC-like DNA-binding protein
MQAIGKIGVIMPHVVPPMDNELLCGISETFSACGYDTVLITGLLNFLSENSSDNYAIGLENIYALCEYADFDGIIFAAGRFLHSDMRDKILAMLRRRSMPVIILEHNCAGFHCIYPQQKKYIRLITEHLIKKHGRRKLYCITGIKGENSSEERLAGFCEALDEAGLHYDENSIFYGCFWHEIPCRIADDIASGKLEMPDGIVCTNDEMATAVCNRLIENGIKVPEQIAVTGYDGNFDSFFNDPPITTVTGRDYQLGNTAAERMLELLGHSPTVPLNAEQRLRIGTSCGCELSSMVSGVSDNRYLLKNIRRNNQMYAERRYFITADMLTKISSCESLDQLMMMTSTLAYILPNWNTLELCMCSDWSFDFEAPDCFRTEGFSDTMLQMLYQKKCVDTNAVGEFGINVLLPSLELPHEPMIYVISSIHHKQQIFGYIGTSYNSANDFLLDEYYVNWCDCVANGINSIQNIMYKAYVKGHFASLLTIDNSTGLYNKRGLMENLPDFIAHCTQKNCRCTAVVLSYESSREHYEISPLFAIANILRRRNETDILLSRPTDRTIICLISSDEESEQKVIDRFNSLIFQNIQETYGNTFNLAMDDIAICCGSLSGRQLADTEKEIDRLIEKAADKAKVLAVKSGNCYTQLQNARRRILEAPQLDWNVDDIAKRSGISKSYFQRLYRETFNTSCMDDIINARIERAKRLLENTDRQISDIAIECGYASGSHFMRQFRQKTGLTATEYRKNAQK